VQDALDRLVRKGTSTVVLVAHRLSTVMSADCIAVVADGRIAEQGTHPELLELGGIYAKLVSRQLSREANQLETAPSNVDALFADEEGEEGDSGGGGGGGGKVPDVEPAAVRRGSQGRRS